MYHKHTKWALGQNHTRCLLQFTCILVWGKLPLITMWLLWFITVEIYKEKSAAVSRSYASIIDLAIHIVMRNVRLIYLKPGYVIIPLQFDQRYYAPIVPTWPVLFHSYICICTGINFARFHFKLLICRMVKASVAQFGVVFLRYFSSSLHIALFYI